LVVTLLASGGITSPNGPRTYGAMAAGTTVTQPFTFTANGACGSTITASLQLQDGPANLGTLNLVLRLGTGGPSTPLNESFDGVTAPALPLGWTTMNLSGTQTNWITSTAANFSAPNAAYIADSTTA